MRLTSDWRRVLRRAYSVRFQALAVVFTGLEVALPMLDGLLPVPRGVFAALSGLTTACAFIARFVAQKGFDDE